MASYAAKFVTPEAADVFAAPTGPSEPFPVLEAEHGRAQREEAIRSPGGAGLAGEDQKEKAEAWKTARVEAAVAVVHNERTCRHVQGEECRENVPGHARVEIYRNGLRSL